MEDLAYYAANAPERTLRRAGRLNTAAVILLLVALPLGWTAFLIGKEAVSDARRGLVISEDVLFFGITGVVSTYFVICAIALITRRRWSRPLVLVGTEAWLLLGTVLFLVLSVLAVRDPYAYGIADSYFDKAFNVTAPLSFAFAFTVAIPWFVRWLVLPDEVRRSLESLDPTPRRSDQWPVGRISVGLATLTLASVVATMLPNLRYSLWWPVDLVPTVRFAAVGGCLLLASGAIFCSGIGAHRAAIAFEIVAFVLLMTIGIEGGKRRPFNYSDSAALICFLLAADVACLLRLRRDRASTQAESLREAAA